MKFSRKARKTYQERAEAPLCMGKVSFIFKAGAKAAKKRMLAHGRGYVGTLDVFRCSVCGNYHLGNNPGVARAALREHREGKAGVE